MSHFDERSGVVYCRTEWGQWAQTIEEVFIEVDVAEGTKSKDICCDMRHRSIAVTVSKREILKVRGITWKVGQADLKYIRVENAC